MTYGITAAHGCEISIGNGASPEVFTEIQGVHNGPNGPGWQPQVIEARHHGSTSIFRKVTNVVEQPVTFDVYYDSTETTHTDLVTAAKTKAKKNFKMTLTDGGAEVYTFGAYVSARYTGQVDGFNIYSIELQVDGAITVG